jgi:hypothetical protein
MPLDLEQAMMSRADMQNTSKFGVGIMIESSTMTQEEMIAAGMLQPM